MYKEYFINMSKIILIKTIRILTPIAFLYFSKQTVQCYKNIHNKKSYKKIHRTFSKHT